MRFFLETEGMVEMKDTGVLSNEDLLLLLLLLDFVWFPLVKTFIIDWGKSMVPDLKMMSKDVFNYHSMNGHLMRILMTT